MKLNATGIDGLARKLQDVGARAKSLRPALEAGANDIKTLIDNAFYFSRDPETGKPWRDIEQSTKDRRPQGDGGGVHKPLMDTGRLRQSIATKADARSIRFGTNVKYGPYHQYGTKHIPQRRFIPESFNAGPAQKTAQKIVRRILNYLVHGKANA